MDLGAKLQILEEQERLYRIRLKRSVANVEKANIRARRKGEQLYFSKYVDGKEESLKGQTDKIIEIILAQCDRKRIAISEKNSAKIAKLTSNLCVADFDKSRNLLRMIGSNMPLYSLDDWKWMKADYETNPFRIEELKYKTRGGVKVRSKSERIIAERLEAWGIPFRTEMRMNISGKTVYPDFVIRRADGTLIVWEHLGLMDDGEYHKKAIEKIELYRESGFVQHKNLICTWEEDIISGDDIDDIIKRFILM